MVHRLGAALRIVEGERHSIQGNNFEVLCVDLQVSIEVGRSIHNASELAFAGHNIDLRPQGAIDGEDLSRHSCTGGAASLGDFD